MKALTSSLRKAGLVALSLLLAVFVTAAGLVYNSNGVSQAQAAEETMTNTIDQKNKDAFTELAQEIDATEEPADEAIEDSSSNSSSAKSETSSSSSSSAKSSASESSSSNSSSASSDESSASSSSSETASSANNGNTPADDCIVTINYLEYGDYDEGDPDVEIDDMGRRVLGTRTLTGLHEGEVLNAWNYVVSLPGHFFYDGWPQVLTVSTDPSQNEIDLIYMKLWNYEYTVNYYLMVGADLTADNWTDALSTGDVDFIKMGSETFENQRFDELIKGDAYEYKLDNLYVIDTYPAQIRLGTDPDNNVINVLYTPDSTSLPDGVEVPDDIEVPDQSGDSGATAPDDSTDLPSDTTLDADGVTSTVPGVSQDSVMKDDFLGTDMDRGQAQITDDMLKNPVSKSDADYVLDAYKTGVNQGELAQTGDNNMWIMLALGAIAIVAVIVIALSLRKKGPAQD